MVVRGYHNVLCQWKHLLDTFVNEVDRRPEFSATFPYDGVVEVEKT